MAMIRLAWLKPHAAPSREAGSRGGACTSAKWGLFSLGPWRGEERGIAAGERALQMKTH